MFAILLITALFVAISVYFYFRAEKLQRDLFILKRELSNTQKEAVALSKSMALLASSHEDFAKNRLNLLLEKTEQSSEKNEVELLKPLFSNYAIIFRECLTGKGNMQKIIKKCFSNQDSEVFNEFTCKVIKADAKFQRLWGSNNLTGFISLVESLLIKHDEIKKTAK